MPKAIWNNTVIAESTHTVMVEGNHYFPPESIKQEYFVEAQMTSRCIWKGKAAYYDIKVGKQTNRGAAWYYPQPWILALNIKDHVAFWNGVKIVK